MAALLLSLGAYGHFDVDDAFNCGTMQLGLKSFYSFTKRLSKSSGESSLDSLLRLKSWGFSSLCLLEKAFAEGPYQVSSSPQAGSLSGKAARKPLGSPVWNGKVAGL